MEQQRKSEISLSPDSWHAKLIKFIWGFSPGDFKNLCPYFWLLMASIVLFPVIAPFKVLALIIFSIADSVSKFLEENIELSFDRYTTSLSRAEIYSIMISNEDNRPDYETAQKRNLVLARIRKNILKITRGKDWYRTLEEKILKLYKEDSSWKNWDKEFKEEVERLELEKKLQEIRLENRQRKFKKRSAVISDIATATKAFFTYTGSLVVSVLLYFLTIAATWTFTRMLSLTTEDYISIVQVALGVIATILCILYFIWALSLIDSKIKYKSDIFWYEWIMLIPSLPVALIFQAAKIILVKFLICRILGGIIEGIYLGFKEYGGIFADYFDASYSDYCPGISWDKTKKENKK